MCRRFGIFAIMFKDKLVCPEKLFNVGQLVFCKVTNPKEDNKNVEKIQFVTWFK